MLQWLRRLLHNHLLAMRQGLQTKCCLTSPFESLRFVLPAKKLGSGFGQLPAAWGLIRSWDGRS